MMRLCTIIASIAKQSSFCLIWIATSTFGLLVMTQTTHAAMFDIKPVETNAAKQVWLLEDTALPIISLKMAFRYGGAISDPEDKPGMANFLSDMLGRGAGDYDNLTFKQMLEDSAIDIGFSVDKDHLYVSLTTLSEHADEAFRLMALTLLKPRFEAPQLALTKEQILSAITQNMESPSYLASLTWNQTAYGAQAYAQPLIGTKASVAAITAENITTFMKQHLTRANLLVSVVGDITPTKLKTLLESSVGGLPEGTPAVAAPMFTAYPDGKTVRIEKPFPQSVAVFGLPGIGVNDPDYYAAALANYILGGGGFESRLMQEIREKRGLAYSVYSYFSSMEASDVLKGSVGTRNDAIDTSLELLKAEFDKMQQHGVTASELAAAKNYMTGSFILSLDSTGNLADYLSYIQLEGLGIDYLARRNSLIEAVTLEDVNRVARTLFNPQKLIITVVGSSKSE